MEGTKLTLHTARLDPYSTRIALSYRKDDDIQARSGNREEEEFAVLLLTCDVMR